MSNNSTHTGKYKIAIVGSRDEILCFRALGVDIYPLKNQKEAASKLLSIKKMLQNEESQEPKYAIIFVMEDIIKSIAEDDLKKLSSGALPAIIGLPGHKGSTGYGDAQIRKLVEKAVGSDIFA